MIESGVISRLVGAAIAGGLVGLEREITRKPAGIRTHMLVSLGAALFVLVGTQIYPSEGARIIAGLITGIGFLGAGTIFKEKDHVAGLTTAASVWAVAAIGAAIGLGEFEIASAAVILSLIILHLNKLKFLKIG
ncbi:MgtC/SapB family protein [Candidatus Woesearchaeota archaeon]|nr:MgtC/SapB family protein [Candidatus Woesearchaeota archaeon]